VQLEDKVAVVIGGANGIGAAIAKEYARAGAAILVADADKESGENVVTTLSTSGGRAEFRLCNAADPASMRALTDSAVELFGRVDVLCYAAGVMQQIGFFDVTEEHFNRILSVNLTGALFACQAAARNMVERREGGSLITVASVGGVLASTNTLAYGASKAALIHLTKSMSVALASYGIRANSVAPGSVETNMLAGMQEEDRHAMLTRTPLRRFGEPAEIAKVALFLASDDSSYVTGQTIFADGGRTVLNRTVPVNR
jgi:NAD(P)-dependent dehydrogenase (short-subunit alcohol dehydrogenase family)